MPDSEKRMKRITLAIHIGVVLLITGFLAFQLTVIVYMGRYTYNNPNNAGIYATGDG